jgi:hypothetical protein
MFPFFQYFKSRVVCNFARHEALGLTYEGCWVGEASFIILWLHDTVGCVLT